MPKEAPINEFAVSIRGDEIVIIALRASMSKERALGLAAWLVAMAGGDREEFEAVLDAVEST